MDYLSKATKTSSIVVNSCNCGPKPSTRLACESRRGRRCLCRADCHNMINQMRLAMTTVRSPSPTVATAASREQTSSRVYCNVRLPWQPACSPLPKQRRNENIPLSSHPSPPHLFLITPPPSLSFFWTGSVTPDLLVLVAVTPPDRAVDAATAPPGSDAVGATRSD